MIRKVMISQRMNGLSDEEIKQNRTRICLYITNSLFPNDPVQILQSFIEEEPKENSINKPIWYLGKSILKMSEANTLVVENGAENARGCNIEIEIAKAYGIDVYQLTETGFKLY